MEALYLGLIFLIIGFILLFIRELLLENPRIYTNKDSRHKSESIRLLFLAIIFTVWGVIIVIISFNNNDQYFINFSSLKVKIIITFSIIILTYFGINLIKTKSQIFKLLTQRGYKSPDNPEKYARTILCFGVLMIIISVSIFILYFF